jgi:hypothetical protein
MLDSTLGLITVVRRNVVTAATLDQRRSLSNSYCNCWFWLQSHHKNDDKWSLELEGFSACINFSGKLIIRTNWGLTCS